MRFSLGKLKPFSVLDRNKKEMIFPLLNCLVLSSLFIAGDSIYPVHASPEGSRPSYVYDRANIISPDYEELLNDYSRQLDMATSTEIIVFTIPGFIGHGIMKDGIEIQDRDSLSNFIYNELSLDGITGIGKKGIDNGVLLLYSSNPDAAGGSMRIEVGRGLEGNITDGIAGEILDRYLVPARDTFNQDRNITVIDNGIFNTVVALGQYSGYSSSDPKYKLSTEISQEESLDYFSIIVLVAIIAIILITILRKRGNYWSRSSRYGGSGWYGGGFGGAGSWTRGGGHSSGGGGHSSGGGAGR